MAFAASHIQRVRRKYLSTNSTGRTTTDDELERVHQLLIDAGVTPNSENFPDRGSKGRIDFWSFYTTVCIDPEELGMPLQQILQQQMDDNKLQSLQERYTRQGRSGEQSAARMQSLQLKSARAPLVVTTKLPEHRLTDAECRLMLRQRMGMAPTKHMPDRCVCGFYHRNDPLHIYKCPRNGQARINSHNRVVNAVAKMARRAGMMADDTNFKAESQKLHGCVPDLELTEADGSLHIIDVSLTTADPKTYNRRHDSSTAAAAEKRERLKMNKYKDLARYRRGEVTTCCHERETCATGPLTESLIQTIATHSTQHSLHPQSAFRIRSTLAIEICKGNTIIQRQAVPRDARAEIIRMRENEYAYNSYITNNSAERKQQTVTTSTTTPGRVTRLTSAALDPTTPTKLHARRALTSVDDAHQGFCNHMATHHKRVADGAKQLTTAPPPVPTTPSKLATKTPIRGQPHHTPRIAKSLCAASRNNSTTQRGGAAASSPA
jgi:hypothetical protein